MKTSSSNQSLVSNPQSEIEKSTATSSDEGNALVIYNKGNQSTSQSQAIKCNYFVPKSFHTVCTLLIKNTFCSTNNLPSNLPKQVSFQLQDFGIKGVLTTQSQKCLAFEPHKEVYHNICLSILLSSFRLLLPVNG